MFIHLLTLLNLSGHGGVGELISGWIANNLPIVLNEEKRAKSRPAKALPAIVRKTVSRLKNHKFPQDISKSGSTACFAILSGERADIYLHKP